MIQIFLVGVGALGADFAIEAARRAQATSNSIQLTLIDFDDVEFPRNCVSQAFYPHDEGRQKADVIAERIKGFNIDVVSVTKKLTKENWSEWISKSEEDYQFIVDAVDNAATRQLLWEIGLMTNIPVLHLGISPKGQGHITWNYQDHDTFPLSPKTTSAKNLAAVVEGAKDVKLPPCELNALRSMILLTAITGVTALYIAAGFDISKEFAEFTTNTQGVLSVWDTELWQSMNKMDFSTMEKL